MDRTVVIALLAIAFGCLFLLTYSLALGNPVPRRIDAALVGDPAAHPRTVDAVQGVAGGKLAFRGYASVPAARHAIDEQRVYAALDLTSTRPTLYVATRPARPWRECSSGSPRSIRRCASSTPIA